MLKPQKPNLGLIDFVRDREGSDKKMQEYEDALALWTQYLISLEPDPNPVRNPDVATASWRVDLKVYERHYRSEIPLLFPVEWFRDENIGSYQRMTSQYHGINDGLPLLETGYKSIRVDATEEIFDEFIDWCYSRGIKVIGITKLTVDNGKNQVT